MALSVVGIGVLWPALRAPTEPTYEGRTLSEWLLRKNADRAAILSALNTVTNDPDPAVGQMAFSLWLRERERQTREDIDRLRFARPDAGRVVMQAEVRRQKPLWAPKETGLTLERIDMEPRAEPVALTNRFPGGR